MSYTIINPATEETGETIEHLSLEQTDEAINKAQKAQKEWAARNPADRAAALRLFADAVDADLENLAQLEVRNSGHPIGQARWEAEHVRNAVLSRALSKGQSAMASEPSFMASVSR